MADLNGDAPVPAVVTRFAPAPTGRLHAGNLRVAVLNALFARAARGRFILRLDDTDRARCTDEYARAIEDDLAWMGLVPDLVVRQSDRDALYEAAFERLRAAGRIYPAYETPEELEIRRKVLLGRGLPPVYERGALALTDADRAALEAEGRRPHWRFRLPDKGALAWDDRVRGPQSFDAATLSDPVVRRADGTWLYMLPSVVDDIDLHLTDVIRGEDHVTNTAVQIAMFEALGAPPPAFAHVALLVSAEGKLSKRLGADGLDAVREAGIEPVTLAALLARIGTSDPVVPAAELDEVAAGLDLRHFGRAPARFDPEELEALNARVLHALPFAAVADRLPAGMDETAWEAIRPNLDRLDQASEWWAVVTGPIATPAAATEDRAFLAQAADLLGQQAGADWKALTAALGPATGRRGKSLFLPLRRALTGRDHGPDMAALLPLIGRDEAVARLRAAAG